MNAKADKSDFTRNFIIELDSVVDADNDLNPTEEEFKRAKRVCEQLRAEIERVTLSHRTPPRKDINPPNARKLTS